MISHHTKGFSLIELLLVITIILILFLASKNLFQTPNKYLIDGEVCINTVHGKLSQFFYQGITGKDKTVNNITYEPNSYKMVISTFAGKTVQGINFFIGTGGDGTASTLFENLFFSQGSSNIPSCYKENNYVVVLSGNSLQNSNDKITITINTDINSKMKICRYKASNPLVCETSFSEKLDYFICKKVGNTIDNSTCRHTFSTRFDTATQSIKSNRCLNILYNTSCKTWSINNF